MRVAMLRAALVIVSAALALLGDVVAAGTILAMVVVTAVIDRSLGDRVRRTLAALDLTATAGAPLVRTINRLVLALTWVVLTLAATMVLADLLRGESRAVTLVACAAVLAAIPLELGVVATGALAARAVRMARRNVAVRDLSAVETLARTTVICADKAGPLTENQVIVTAVVADGRRYETTGAGYSPDGEIRIAGAPVSLGENIALDECLEAGLACNDSRIVDDDSGRRIVGDPAEAAMVICAAKLGVDKALPRIDTLPFAADRRFMATLHRLRGDEPGVLYVKGSVERVLYLCQTQLDANGRLRGLDGEGIRAAAQSFGRRGLRVVAFAYAQAAPQADRLTERTLPPMVFLGMQVMYDPVRPWAAEAVRTCQGAGLLVKMITEDDADVARATAAWIGLDGDELMTGAELRACPADALPEAVTRTAVLSHTSPEERLLLVRALQSRHHVVAMTGRTPDDLPALRQADIGVDARPPDASGLEDTRPIWRVAEVSLLDGDFASILAAVEEGRRALGQFARYLEWALPIALGPSLVLATATLAGTARPIEPVQVLWLSLIAVLLLRLPLGVLVTGESPAYDAAFRKPRAGAPVMVTLAVVGGAFALFAWAQAYGAGPAEARTAVVNALAAMTVVHLLGRRRGRLLAVRPIGLLTLATLVACQLAFTYVPTLNDMFGSAPLDGAAWLGVMVVAATCLLLTVPISRRRSASHRAPAAARS